MGRDKFAALDPSTAILGMLADGLQIQEGAFGCIPFYDSDIVKANR